MRCKCCANIIEAAAKFREKCGMPNKAAFETNERESSYCLHCGNLLDKGTAFCGKSGVNVDNYA